MLPDQPKNIVVYLKSTRRADIRKEHPALVHEAAHVKHHYLDPGFSEIWLAKFPIERPQNQGAWEEPYVSKLNGLVDRRAAFDYLLDRFEFNLPEHRANHTATIDGVTFELHGERLNTQLALQNLRQELDMLPRVLKGYVRHIVFYPDLKCLGVTCFYGDDTESRKKAAEDIAYSTSGFYAASIYPAAHRAIIAQVHENPKTRERLEFLIQTGFLDHSQSAKLLDFRYREQILAEEPKPEPQSAPATKPQLREVRTHTMFDGGYLI